jgi:hypothetical protein
VQSNAFIVVFRGRLLRTIIAPHVTRLHSIINQELKRLVFGDVKKQVNADFQGAVNAVFIIEKVTSCDAAGGFARTYQKQTPKSRPFHPTPGMDSLCNDIKKSALYSMQQYNWH